VHLEIRSVTKAYGSARALDDFTLSLPAGRIVALIGLNGAGKTTLLRTLAGIAAPTRGEVTMDGVPFHRGRLDLRRRLLFLADFPALYGQLNVLQNAALTLRLYERDPRAAEAVIMGALRDFDLLPQAESPLALLSRGQIYKAALVALLAVAPELWLLDEPFASGLDPQGIAALKQHARAAAATGATVIYSTQILEIAEKFCDMLVVIDRGRVRATYPREQLAALPPHGPGSLEEQLAQFRAPAA
jgi:ABC-type multidrug transport system ATPase subunit